MSFPRLAPFFCSALALAAGCAAKSTAPPAGARPPSSDAAAYPPGSLGANLQTIADARCARVSQCGPMPNDATPQKCAEAAVAATCAKTDCRKHDPTEPEIVTDCARAIRSEECTASQSGEVPDECPFGHD